MASFNPRSGSIGRGTAWKHAQQQNLGAWKACAQGRQNRLDACGSFLRGILPRTGVVGPDHHEHQLGSKPLDLPMIQPPRHVLGPITDESQVHGLRRPKYASQMW
jgi:hypothetical protein